MGWQMGIPPHLLTVLQQVILIGVRTVAHHISRSVFGNAGHIVYFTAFGQFGQFSPTAKPTFVSCIIAGNLSPQIGATIAAGIHQTPDVHTISATIIDVIKVGQTQIVTEFVTESTDAVRNGTRLT